MREQHVQRNPGWNWDNSYTRLPQLLYTRLDPTPVSSPTLVVLNERLAARLGLEAEYLRSGGGIDVLAGNRVPQGSEPIAQAYAGHQFGHFNRLGDGRAILIGEQLTPDGTRFDVQWKGPGPTPYSRGGDGRAALGPMLREYIISEAMHALGIPTSRSLAVVATGEPVYRSEELQGAILTRVAASHIRVGTFQYAAAWGTEDDLRALADYTLNRHFPHIGQAEDRYAALLKETAARQAELIARWQLVGFIHGVMNTDNMAISGETIDYGPCAFMDSYDPATVFSSIDSQGRYAYGNQPRIAMWNLARLAEALLPLLHEEEEEAVRLAEAELAAFPEQYRKHWLQGMRAKLGLMSEEAEDEKLIQSLLEAMKQHDADYTNTFVALTLCSIDSQTETTAGTGALLGSESFRSWREQWRARLDRQPQPRSEAERLMRASNPALIPRNHRVEEALSAAEEGDLGVMERLLEALSQPYAYDRLPEKAPYTEPPAPSGPRYRTFCGT